MNDDEDATCRWCRRVLKGKAAYLGGSAYNPDTNEQVPRNHYGGFVCSRECDFRASLELESSMPGCGKATRLSPYAAETLRRNWPATV